MDYFNEIEIVHSVVYVILGRNRYQTGFYLFMSCIHHKKLQIPDSSSLLSHSSIIPCQHWPATRFNAFHVMVTH